MYKEAFANWVLGAAVTLDGPGRSRGRGPGLLTPAGLVRAYLHRPAIETETEKDGC